MCRATLLPEPDSPLRTMMRTTGWYPQGLPLQVPRRASGLARLRRAGAVGDALFLVLHQAAVDLVGQQVDGGVHVLFGGVRVDGAAAYVQGDFGFLAQLL